MKVQCTKCQDIIESLYGHDFKYCSCGQIYIDGGLTYWRLGFQARSDIHFVDGVPENWVDSLIDEIEEEDNDE